MNIHSFFTLQYVERGNAIMEPLDEISSDVRHSVL